MSAQLSLPRCGQRRSGRRIWANDASHSWELGLITPEWSNTELWAEGTGQLLIYGAQAVIAKVSQCPACLFFPPWEACPAQEQLQGRAGTCLLQCCFITEHQTQPLLTQRDLSKGSFPFHLPAVPLSFLSIKPPDSSLLGLCSPTASLRCCAEHTSQPGEQKQHNHISTGLHPN